MQWPCDMADDLLEDCITVTVSKLEKMEEDEEDLQAAGVRISQVRVCVRVRAAVVVGWGRDHLLGHLLADWRRKCV